MSPARPGAFNANFAPETLKAFKALCRKQEKQYIKVLEQIAEIYLKSEGAVFEQMSVPSSIETVGSSRHLGGVSSSITPRGTYAEMLERLERVEADDREFVSAFEILIHRVDALEQKKGSVDDGEKYVPKKSS